MRGSEKLLALAIAGTLVAGIVVVLVRDVQEEPLAQPTPTLTGTVSPSPTDTATVEPTDTETVEPTGTATGEPTGEPSPEPTPTRTKPPKENGDLPDTGVPASIWFGLLMLAGAGLVYLELKRVY